MTTKFFVQRQNNVGGTMRVNASENRYICIEAKSEKQADRYRADVIGQDYCECCGERWYDNWAEFNSLDKVYQTYPRADVAFHPYNNVKGH